MLTTDIKVREMGTTSTQVYAMGLKDGASVSSGWIQANLMLGKVYTIYSGSATTVATFDNTYSATDPEICLDVLDGTTIIPLKILIYYEDFGTNAIVETFTRVSKTLGASTATVIIPINVRTRAAGGSACLATTSPTVTTGDTTGSFDFARGGHHLALDVLSADDASAAQNTRRNWTWTYMQDGFAPMIDGEGSLQTWVIGQAAKGFLQYYWLEFPTADLIS